jgi:hypothetical protein
MDKKHSRKENYPNGFVESWFQEKKSKSKSSKSKFIPVSIILSIQNNFLLEKENNYVLKFNTGMIEGKGITINELGTIITFDNEGSYRFEICGNAIIFSDSDVKLIYKSESFTDEIKIFSETPISKDENKLFLRGISTILPIKKDQAITIRLQATPDEKIIINEGTRLLIYRVA